MAPPKAGFKTYEAQTRLLAAVIATNKGIKLDFKGKKYVYALRAASTRSASIASVQSPTSLLSSYRCQNPPYLSKPSMSLLCTRWPVEYGDLMGLPALAAHCGKGMSPSSVDHRLRPIKQLAKMQAKAVEQEEDPGELPIEKSGRPALLPSPSFQPPLACSQLHCILPHYSLHQST